MITKEMRTKAMRQLVRAGVTHFVVSDELYNRMQGEMVEQNENLGKDVAAYDGGPLSFRGRRLLRQYDLMHLPFHPGPAQPPR